ncbi:ABC transporter ATP-binding protein [Camelimonas lactis]|uniref:Branched-chain amino acid transport system ATP-binding protein n=1 Tax=Camelimonas lactis TaxID=659006 RepID=A0A4R2GKT5_9HYPH|nr:ABC transporter ATP-binding protein [Camelimonas lactis]TCO09487.1 branched-chain amino acid transport system ATP-binding protein [Camelimonas lactis]
MLEIGKLRSRYGRIEVLHDVSLEVGQGEIVALVGANGAGKTTLMRAISGIQPITAGTITLAGVKIHNDPPARRVAQGLAQVPEGRQIFAPLPVEDNLALGAWVSRSRIERNRSRVYEMFPILGEFRKRAAGSLSGGQQQMLAMGRALMSDPRVLLLDEPTMGLAPLLAKQVMEIMRTIRDAGTTILVVEQNVQAVLRSADRGYVIDRGRIAMAGPAKDLLADPRVQEAYLGV